MRRRRSYSQNQDPREITARYNSKCAETGLPILKGELCVYYPNSRKVYHLDSDTAEEFRAWKFDVEVLGKEY